MIMLNNVCRLDSSILCILTGIAEVVCHIGNKLWFVLMNLAGLFQFNYLFY